METIAEMHYTVDASHVRLRLLRDEGGSFALSFGDDGARTTTPFGTRAELLAMLPEHEAEGEVGYLLARAIIVDAFDDVGIPYIGPADDPEIFVPDRGGQLITDAEEEAILTKLVEQMRSGEI